MGLKNQRLRQILHWMIVYPLALIGGFVMFGSLILFIDTKREIPAELICTPGFPCHEQFDN